MNNRQSRSKANEIEIIDEQQLNSLQMLNLSKKRYREFTEVYTSQHTHYYICEEIGDPSEYIEMFHRLNTASEDDIIFFHLNTPGGNLDTGIQLISAIRNTSAKIVTILEGNAYSLGTLIFLVGDVLIVNDHSVMMFHNFSGGLRGKGNEMLGELNASVILFTSIAEDIYLPFLSKDELERIKKGEDIWMQSDEIRERLKNVIDLKEQQLNSLDQ